MLIVYKSTGKFWHKKIHRVEIRVTRNSTRNSTRQFWILVVLLWAKVYRRSCTLYGRRIRGGSVSRTVCSRRSWRSSCRRRPCWRSWRSPSSVTSPSATHCAPRPCRHRHELSGRSSRSGWARPWPPCRSQCTLAPTTTSTTHATLTTHLCDHTTHDTTRPCDAFIANLWLCDFTHLSITSTHRITSLWRHILRPPVCVILGRTDLYLYPICVIPWPPISTSDVTLTAGHCQTRWSAAFRARGWLRW